MNITTGTRVLFFGKFSVDYSTTGTVTQSPAVDPDGNVFEDMREVTWDDGEVEILSIDDIVRADAYLTNA